MAGAGSITPSTVGRRFATATPPTTGSTLLASAWCSSRSQLAAHSGFAFELKAEPKTRLRRAAVRDELPHFSTERLGTNHRKGRLVAAGFCNPFSALSWDCWSVIANQCIDIFLAMYNRRNYGS